MRSTLTRVRDESGQAIVLVAGLLVFLVGMAGLVIDVGSWYHADRKLQTAADAGALAGAQHLPTDQGTATTVARDYAQRNYSGIPAPTVTFPSAGEIDVRATATAPGFFSRVISSTFSSVQVRAHARAAVSVPLFMKNVAPIAVKNTAACIVSDPSCYGQTKTVSFDESQLTSSTIGLIDLRCQSSTSAFSCGGGPGGSELAGWIDNGYPNPLPANQWYDVKTGVTVGPIDHALNDAANAGRTLFFPVFDQADAANTSFHVIGWAAFVIDPGGVEWGPHTKELTGHFVTFIATDLASGGTIDGASDFGVHVITLTQ
jgi:Flp pilus assembly protein TadG